MSWLGCIPWSQGIKKRACRYLLQRYLGQFLEEKLTLDQLTVDLYNGTGRVTNVSLDVQVFACFLCFKPLAETNKDKTKPFLCLC